MSFYVFIVFSCVYTLYMYSPATNIWTIAIIFASRMDIMKRILNLVIVSFLFAPATWAEEYIGNYSANKNNPDSTSNPYGAGSPYNANSINTPNGTYGSPNSSKSAANPYTSDAPKLYDSQGDYRGKLSTNPYDAESTSNPHGRYGSPYSSESINNPYGAGSPYESDSPTNPYGEGLEIYGE